MKVITVLSVDSSLNAMAQHCGLGLLTTMKSKSMDQEKKRENMFTQEIVLEL